jgi:hypothetical protein
MARPGTFQKGMSGNPKGRSKKIRSIEQAALKHADQVVSVFVNILEHGESEQARISAGREILDRAFGKPPQAITNNVQGKIILSWEQ